jgi:hypothetical protein
LNEKDQRLINLVEEAKRLLKLNFLIFYRATGFGQSIPLTSMLAQPHYFLERQSLSRSDGDEN